MSEESEYGIVKFATAYILTQKSAGQAGLAVAFDGRRYSLNTTNKQRCVCRAKKIETLQTFLDGVEFARGETE